MHLLITCILVFGLLYGEIASAASPPKSLSHADLVDIRRVAVGLKEAILHKDINRILKHISRTSGLTCTDDQYPYREVVKDIHDKKSYFYMSLFDSARYSKRCGQSYSAAFPALSDQDFFAAENNQDIEIVPYPPNGAQVIFKSHIKNHYPRKFDFERVGRGWKLGNGMIIGNCDCG